MRRITSLSELEVLAPAWRRLAPEGTPPFQTFGWNRAWFRHYHREYDEISVFVFHSASRVAAIVPCYRRKNELRLAGDRICDFQDAIVRDRNDSPEILRQLCQYARNHRLRLCFDMLSGRGVLLGAIRRMTDRTGYLCYTKKVGPCPWFQLPENEVAFLGSLRKSCRKKVRRALRRLDQAMPDHRFTFRKGGELDEAEFREIGDLHRRNQFRKRGASDFEDPVYRDFLAEVAGSPNVGMRLFELRNREGDLIAFDLGFASGERFYVYVGSWDAPHEQCSPGVCLLHREVIELPRHGFQLYDFLRGDEDYKFNYATASYPVYRAMICPRSPGNELRVRLLRGLDRAKSLAKPGYRRLCQASRKLHQVVRRDTGTK